jgi:hypothetical protein
MSDAKRCDITGLCIPEGESAQSTWEVRAGTVTILGKPGVTVALEVRVTIDGFTGRVDLSQEARDAVESRIKQYFASL